MRGQVFAKISLAVGVVTLIAGSVSAESIIYHSVEQSSNSSGGGSVSNYSSSTVNINSSSSSSVSQSSNSSSSSSESGSHSSSKTVTTTIRNGKMVTVTRTTGDDGKTTETTTEAPAETDVNVTVPGGDGHSHSIVIRSKPGGGFEIIQDGVVVSTNLPLQLNDAQTQVQIVDGDHVVTVGQLPSDAAEALKRFGKFGDLSRFELTNNGGLNYSAQGIRTVKLFGFIPIKAAITVRSSADTGALNIANQPWYLAHLGFLFRS